MKKSFTSLIKAIHHYPDYIQDRHLGYLLHDADRGSLEDLAVLKRGSDLKEVLCQSCDEDHFLEVRVEDGKIYCFCPQSDIDRNYLEPHEVKTWCFEVEIFLQKLAHQLDIDDHVEKLEVQNMWQVGGFSKDDTRYNCYYYQGKYFEEALAFIQRQPSHMRRYIIFMNKEEIPSSLETEHELLFIEVNELTELKGKQLVFNKKHFNELLIHGFRSVFFNPKNGDLIVNGRPISRITPASPEYYFTELLWKNFNEPVSHKKIESYIFEKTKKEYSDTAGNLCYKQKKKIKETSEESKIIDEIFQTTNDLNGDNAFIMRSPS